MPRVSKAAARMRKIRQCEDETKREIRLKADRVRHQTRRNDETVALHEDRKALLRSYMKKQLSRESEESKQVRLSEVRLSVKKRLLEETGSQRKQRLDLIRQRLSNESEEQRARRLSLINARRANENEEQHKQRLNSIKTRLSKETAEQRSHRLNVIKQRLSHETDEKRAHRLQVISKRVSAETKKQRKRRLRKIDDRLANETKDERSHRIKLIKARQSKKIANETQAQKAQRLLNKQNSAKTRKICINLQCFRDSINVFADVCCAVCHKMLYPQQRRTARTGPLNTFIPIELSSNDEITTCNRCLSTLRKKKIPSQAYWNKMLLPSIPAEIEALSELEKRLLSRVVPFMKIIRVQKRFGQDWCKGQVVLFAQDVAELAEQLPLQAHQAGVIIVAENLQHIKRCREFQIDVARLKAALQWMLANNAMYKDVRPCFSSLVSIESLHQIVHQADIATTEVPLKPSTAGNAIVTFKRISEDIRILRGSFHQGDARFSDETRGRQCTAISAMACAAFSLSNAEEWNAKDIDYILLLGDNYYRECISNRQEPDPLEANREFLAVTELLPFIVYDNKRIKLDVKYESTINGHINVDNTEEGFPNLMNGLRRFFSESTVGILTANSISIGLYSGNFSESRCFWLFDSHSLGPKGCRAPLKGVACCMKVSNLERLYAIIRRNLSTKSSNLLNDHTVNIYCLTPLIFELVDNNNQAVTQHINSSIQMPDSPISLIAATSMLCDESEKIPSLESVVMLRSTQHKANKIIRKTAPPLNLEREKRMEELGWYFLFPNGTNGFGEERQIRISPLDYFQAQVMGKDKRFSRNDYLFFALSVVEFFRAKSSVSVACKMQLEDGPPSNLLENMHITMRSIRGSSSYWRQASAELIAMVRSLGPPAWFLTFSCNDLNWPDMIKAMMIADNQDPTKGASLSFNERLHLVQSYPVVVARQFNIRVNALMRYLKADRECLGGPVTDYWYRVEFQNRGSPHLHMLVWCTNMPDFTTDAGINLIEQVVHCSASSDLPQITKMINDLQTHKHTETCRKDRQDVVCRFGFPRPVSEETICLGPDEALANNGRFCKLRRAASDRMINNYNPTLLNLWEANMDIQPCGNVAAVAYDVAKYASKAEPQDTGNTVRQAIKSAKRQGGTIWKQLFTVSMAILTQRLVSAPECAYRLCHLPLKMSTRKAVFVNSCKPTERFRILRLEHQDSTFYHNIFDKYELRPDSLEELSLAEFAVRYESISNKIWLEEDGDADNFEKESESTSYINLKNNTRMRKRIKPAVLRTRYYTINSNRENYFYSLLVCHVPFRSERLLLGENESAEACFLRRQQELKPLFPDVSTEEFTHAEHVIQQALAQAVSFQAVCNNNDINDEPTTHAETHEGYVDNDYIEQPTNQKLMSDLEFISKIRGLNNQQKELLKFITESIEQDITKERSSLKLFITGGAGSGKSFVLKLLVEHIKRCYAPTVDVLQNPTFVEVAALTGVAARQIHGKTLHSLFSLPIEKGSTMTYKKLTGHRLEQERRKWRHIRWLIIDEISMVSYENLRIIHLRLQGLKNNTELFGGVSIVLFGDIMQLPPVQGHWCFNQPAWFSAEINLWHQFSFRELTINMRQQEDIDFIDLLNNLRVGELTAHQLGLLFKRSRIPQEGAFEDGAAIRIFPTLKQVEEYNNKMTIATARSKKTYLIKCDDESREHRTYGQKPPENVIPKDDNKCGGLLKSIELCISSRVMLRRNIEISQGLVNGAMGIVKGFKWPALRRDQLEPGELPDGVYIQFDDVTIGEKSKNNEGFVMIAPVIATFQASRGYGDVERRMLPLILSWAVTVHKLQGTLLEKAVIDLGKKMFAKGQAYVALSRVKSLDGVVVCDIETGKLLKNPHDKHALAEMQRLRDLKS